MSSEAEALSKVIARMATDIAFLREQVQELNDKLSDRIPKEQGWLPTSEAWQALGFSSRKRLLYLHSQGLFRFEKGEVRNVARTGDRPTWEFYIPKCQKRVHDYYSQRKVG